MNSRQTTATTVPEPFPDLASGITLLTTDETVSNAIHALAVDHTLRSGGETLWIDPGTHARTDPLVELAPSDRILDRVRVARAFTPFQQHDLLDSLSEFVTDRTELVVVPQLDHYYREESLLADEGRELLLAGIAALSAIAREREIPILVTRQRDDSVSEPVERAATRTITCESTPFGRRFRTGETETLVYPPDGSGTVQTTLAFWRDILAAREPLYDLTARTPREEYGTN